MAAIMERAATIDEDKELRLEEVVLKLKVENQVTNQLKRTILV